MATRREPTTRRRRPRSRDPRSEPPLPRPTRDPLEPDDRLPPWAPPPSSWRDHVVGASGLNVLAGVWLIGAPWVLNYSSGDPYWNDVVFGGVIALFGLLRAFGAYRESWLSWLNALAGAWLFVSAFWLDQTGRAAWNDIVLGLVVFGLAGWSALATEGGPPPTPGLPSRWARGLTGRATGRASASRPSAARAVSDGEPVGCARGGEAG